MGEGGGYIHIFMFCPTSFFSNQIQVSQFEKKSVGQNMNIHFPPPHTINILVTSSCWVLKYLIFPSTVTHSFYSFQFQGMRRNFISYRYGPINTLDEPYDFLSIMHYDNKAFTKNGKDTLQSLTNPKMKLGQTKRLTKTDVNQINKLYRCGTRVRKGRYILYTVQGE